MFIKHPFTFKESIPYPPQDDNMQHHPNIQLLQYSNAYFNPYEVKHRKRTTRAQLSVLEATFAETPKPTRDVKKALSAQLDMPLRNVQVWFQNRRAKDKHIAAKKALQADKGSDEDDDADDDGEKPTAEAEEQQRQNPSPLPVNAAAAAPHRRSSTPSELPQDSFLVPPTANVSLRRGSAPSLGLPPRLNTRQSSLANNRVVSDTIRQAHHAALAQQRTSPIPEGDPSHLAVPSENVFARRRSLPAFHPDVQQQLALRASQMNPLPTIIDFNGTDSQQAETTSNHPQAGHGGVYRFGSLASRVAPSPYPLRGPMGSTRSGSMPGAGVFRMPSGQNGTAPWLPGSDTCGLGNGLASDILGAAASASQDPFAFPPRRFVPDAPNPGPLPQADFSFGDSRGEESSSFLDQNIGPGNEDDVEEFARMAMSQRFGSFASNYSIDSDATGVSVTTATSSVIGPPSSSPNARLNGYVGRPGWNGFPSRQIYSAEGAPISYGHTDGFSGGAVKFPNRFDPEARRASCPAHFVEQFASFAVEGFPGSFNPNNQMTNPWQQNTLRKMSSSLLGTKQASPEQTEPLTAVFSTYSSNPFNHTSPVKAGTPVPQDYSPVHSSSSSSRQPTESPAMMNNSNVLSTFLFGTMNGSDHQSPSSASSGSTAPADLMVQLNGQEIFGHSRQGSLNSTAYDSASSSWGSHLPASSSQSYLPLGKTDMFSPTDIAFNYGLQDQMPATATSFQSNGADESGLGHTFQQQQQQQQVLYEEPRSFEQLSTYGQQQNFDIHDTTGSLASTNDFAFIHAPAPIVPATINTTYGGSLAETVGTQGW